MSIAIIDLGKNGMQAWDAGRLALQVNRCTGGNIGHNEPPKRFSLRPNFVRPEDMCMVQSESTKTSRFAPAVRCRAGEKALQTSERGKVEGDVGNFAQ